MFLCRNQSSFSVLTYCPFISLWTWTAHPTRLILWPKSKNHAEIINVVPPVQLFWNKKKPTLKRSFWKKKLPLEFVQPTPPCSMFFDPQKTHSGFQEPWCGVLDRQRQNWCVVHTDETSLLVLISFSVFSREKRSGKFENTLIR